MSDGQTISTDICVIGAGAAGLSVAASAAILGVPVTLVERAEMGGDCLNRGCVPSKALIAAAAAAHAGATAGRFGIDFRSFTVNGPAVMAHVRAVIAGVAPVDSVQRYRGMNVRVIEGEARFIDPRTVAAGGQRIVARRFVIAAGGAPAIPDIPGLDTVSYLTSDTVFALPDLPRRLAILGGGPIGTELAQAFRRLGCEVAMIVSGALLPREDAEAVAVARRRLVAEGVRIYEHATLARVEAVTSGVTLDLTGPGAPAMLNASHLLIATGRTPRLDGLGLAAAGVETTPAGIVVDKGLRTTNRRVYAIGDCIDGPRFTHVAGHQAGLVIRNAVFRLPVTAEYRAVPRVTYTDPEIAAVGLSEAEARAAHKGVQTVRAPFAENDRARTALTPEGFVKAVIDGKGRVLGATIVGPHAGELIAPWTLAMAQGLKIGALAGMIAPYPTLGEASRRAALQSLAPKLRSPWLPRLVRLLRRLG